MPNKYSPSSANRLGRAANIRLSALMINIKYQFQPANSSQQTPANSTAIFCPIAFEFGIADHACRRSYNSPQPPFDRRGTKMLRQILSGNKLNSFVTDQLRSDRGDGVCPRLRSK
jgi:hypothetical protein